MVWIGIGQGRKIMSARDIINAAAASSAAATYVEDVFSTDTYTGNGLSVGYKDIVNNIPLNSSSAWWGAKWVGPTGGAFGTRVTADPSGNVYVCGSVVDTFGRSFIAKYNSSGTLQWQRIVSESSSFGYAQGITSDSSGNVYITGHATDTLQHAYVIKYNTSGTLQWHRKLQNGSTRGRGIAVDSSGNVYVTGSFQPDSSRVFTAKYNSSGTLQWQRQLTPIGSEYSGYGVDIAADSSGNVYVTAQIDQVHTFATILVLKYNTSGTLQWHRKAYQNSSFAGGIAVDSSGNVYIGGVIAEYSGSYPNNITSGYIIKYNTSGTLQWQRKLRITGGSTPGGGNISGISVDSSGNSYVAGNCGDTNGGVNVLGLVAKYNTSGTLQWQRHFRHGNGVGQNGGYPNGIYADSSNVYVTGTCDGSNNAGFVIKISQDGNTSGTVNGGTLSVGIATESAGTATDFAGTTTDTAGSATESAGTATDAVGTAISTTQVINAVDGGGLVWMKARTNTGSPINHALYDSVRGTTKELSSNLTSSEAQVTNGLTAFGANGFTIGAAQNINSTAQYVAWTFRKQPKFFDIVTYTGNGASARSIPHSLKSVPGFIIVKRLIVGGGDEYPGWMTRHIYSDSKLNLNDPYSTSVIGSYPDGFVGPPSSSSTFEVYSSNTFDVVNVNENGVAYVAYLFAHNAGGFGISGTDNVISCGSYTGTSGTGTDITLGYEPQWLMIKSTNTTGDWKIYDNMRGMVVPTLGTPQTPRLRANHDGVENIEANSPAATATGFTRGGNNNEGVNYIYIAIRRGPMRTPTTGTSVFAVTKQEPSSLPSGVFTTNFPVDSQWNASLGNPGSQSWYGGVAVLDRLRGVSTTNTATYSNTLITYDTAAESVSQGCATQNWNNTGYNVYAIGSGNFVSWNFRRAPGFMDVVCYTGTGNIVAQSHNLGATPELVIVKKRTAPGYGEDWYVRAPTCVANGDFLLLNSGAAQALGGAKITSLTSTTFTVQNETAQNTDTYVAYLFATCPGVSKVGSYTGNGSSQTINCGFTTGARFVLIKRTNSTGDWYVWDTARGIVSANDPHLSLNSIAAEVTTNDSVDPDNTGFIVNQVSATNVNVTSATYIYLAIA